MAEVAVGMSHFKKRKRLLHHEPTFPEWLWRYFIYPFYKTEQLCLMYGAGGSKILNTLNTDESYKYIL